MGDHPRLRGEKCFIRIASRISKGSPPLTRGKAVDHLRRDLLAGITPAYAGKSRGGGRRVWRRQDHPRLRGEKMYYTRRMPRGVGSPPLTRGKDPLSSIICFRLRITPAYAGKSSAKFRRWPGMRDHPRLRGEKPKPMPAPSARTGSPPLTRGKEVYPELEPEVTRITPAYAGKRPRCGSSCV